MIFRRVFWMVVKPRPLPFSKIVKRRGGYSDWDWGVLWP